MHVLTFCFIMFRICCIFDSNEHTCAQGGLFGQRPKGLKGKFKAGNEEPSDSAGDKGSAASDKASDKVWGEMCALRSGECMAASDGFGCTDMAWSAC